MKAKPVEIVDFEMRRFRRGASKILRVADKLGFIGITENGKRVSYLVSSNFWRTGVLNSDTITTITNRGKLVAYLVPPDFWDLGIRFVGSFSPAARRRLPGIARAAALRGTREAKALKR
jgi:antitoxin (DNA-binding transcriptional repressor) of toxin-antitoxin stability system